MTRYTARHLPAALLATLGYALTSGVLLACAFPPLSWTGAAWLGLVPLLWAIDRSPTTGRAYLLGSFAGFAFFLITIHPLTSAASWSGWISETPHMFATRVARQWGWLHGVWVAFALFGTIFWGGWAALTHRCGQTGRWRGLLATAGAWILIPEWLRAQTTFGCTWAFLGNALATIPALRQWAAIGGVWLLSALAVLVNAAVARALGRRTSRRWQLLVAAAGMVAVAWGGGSLMRAHTKSIAALGAPIHAAVIQYEKRGEYVPFDYTPLGIDRGYIPLIQQTLTRPVDVLVLPESIVLGTVSLDGSMSRVKPPDYQMPVALWDDEMRALLSGRSTVMVVGMDTVEEGEDHNTLVAWTAEGRAGAYHKRRLVPFSEYQPSGWGAWTLQGRSPYVPGYGGQTIRANGLRLGGVICQEVVFPALLRESVRDGAALLVSGGQDGVFADPAVSTVEAQLAQLRAVETGRFFVRANKQGVSAIIDPSGEELARSPVHEPAVLRAVVRERTHFTPYVRFGDWVVWLAALLVAVVGVPAWMAARAHARLFPEPARPAFQYPWVVAWSLGITGLMALGLSRAGRLDLMSVWLLRDFLGYGHFTLAYLFTWRLVRRQLVTRTAAAGYLALFLGVIALYACLQRRWLAPAMDLLFIMTLFMTHHASNELLFRQQTRNGYQPCTWTARRTLWVALAVWLVVVDQLGHPQHAWHAAQPTAAGLWAAGWLVYGWTYALRAPRRPSAVWGWLGAGGLGAWCALHPMRALVFTSLFRFGWIIIYHYVAWYVFYTYKLVHRNGGWRMTAPAPRSSAAAWRLATTTPWGFLLLVLAGNLAIFVMFLVTRPLAHHLAASTGLNFFHINTVAHIVFGAGLPQTIAARSVATSREIPEPIPQFA